jgi:Tol biopolymer transport system component
MRRTRSTRLIIAFVLLALAVAGLPAAPAAAAHPGTNGAIAFTMAAYDCRAYCTNYRDIFVTDKEGAKLPVRRAGSSLQYDDSADWSPDGNEIVFTAYPYGVSYIDIYKMNADGSNVEALTNNHYNSSPRWSPDGETIAFTRNNTGGWPELWLMDADGTNERQVPIDYYTSTLAWMPDGRISFWGNPDNFSQNGLYATDVAGTTVEEIVTLTEMGAAIGAGQNFPRSLDWSPDGSRAVFAASTTASPTKQCDASGAGQQDIWTVTSTGVLKAVTTTDGDLEPYEDDPVWSPTGGRIAFSGYKYSCVGEGRDQTVQMGYSKLYTMKADGTDRQLIVDPPSGPDFGHNVMRPSWQPCTSATVVCGRGAGTGGYPIQDETPPTVDDAARAVPQGSSLSLSKLPVRFTWSATDNETPASKLLFDVQLRDMSTTTWVNLVKAGPERTATALLLPGRTYRLRHRATDQWGNTSAFLTSPEFKAEAAQETTVAPKLVYNGAWTRVARDGAFGGYVRTSNEVNAYATTTFTGYRGVGVVLPRRADLGVARVCLLRTGVDPDCADLNLSTETDPRRLVFARNKLNPGFEYKLRVRVLSGRVDLDVFEGIN